MFSMVKYEIVLWFFQFNILQLSVCYSTFFPLSRSGVSYMRMFSKRAKKYIQRIKYLHAISLNEISGINLKFKLRIFVDVFFGIWIFETRFGAVQSAIFIIDKAVKSSPRKHNLNAQPYHFYGSFFCKSLRFFGFISKALEAKSFKIPKEEEKFAS